MSSSKYDQVPLAPITNQPVSGFPGHQSVTIPISVPPGLESLLYLNTLVVKQKRELAEILCGCETNNRYKIRDTAGNELFTAKEDTDFCTRQCCGPARPFDIRIENGQGQEVIHISRPFACGCWCCDCSLHKVTIQSPPGVVIGTVEQVNVGCGSCTPKYLVKNGEDQLVLRVEGEDCGYCCNCCTMKFNVLSGDGSTVVGEIQKQWSGLVREMFTDADNFGISFPPDLDVRMKAVLLGALFLIDFMFFEQTQR